MLRNRNNADKRIEELIRRTYKSVKLEFDPILHKVNEGENRIEIETGGFLSQSLFVPGQGKRLAFRCIVESAQFGPSTAVVVIDQAGRCGIYTRIGATWGRLNPQVEAVLKPLATGESSTAPPDRDFASLWDSIS